MNWSNRASWSAMTMVAVGVVSGVMVSAQPAALAGPPAIPERNCWDPTQWERPPVQCEIPVPPTLPPDKTPEEAPDETKTTPRFVSHDLASSRGHSLPAGTLQVVTYYDGDVTSRPTLRIEYSDPGSGSGWLEVTDIHTSTSDRGTIDTFEYQLGDARLTGNFEIDGIVPNGVIDGLAFGLFWRDAEGFHMLRSTAPQPMQRTMLVGMWPLFLNDRSFERRTPQLTNPAARAQAKIAIYGAEYLQNGRYAMTIQERTVQISHRAVSE